MKKRPIPSGECRNCGWVREATLYPDGRIVLYASSFGAANQDPKKCEECRRWSSTP